MSRRDEIIFLERRAHEEAQKARQARTSGWHRAAIAAHGELSVRYMAEANLLRRRDWLGL